MDCKALEEVCDYARSSGAPRSARREARRHRLDLARVLGCVPRAARRRSAARRRDDREPVPRARLGRAVPRRLPSARRGCVLPRAHVERRRDRRPGPRPLGRASALASRRRARARVGRAARRRARLSSVGAVVGATYPRAVSRGAATSAAVVRSCSPASARRARRRPTSRARSPRARERARHGVAVGHLRVPRHRGGLARGGAAAEAGRSRPQVWAAAGW